MTDEDDYQDRPSRRFSFAVALLMGALILLLLTVGMVVS